MVRINNITANDGIECEILAKCEFLNPGGSVKDRIGRRMVLDAMKSGKVKKGDVLIEPTSGNTGIGLSVTAASKGLKMVITMPEKMSQEKRDVLKALGAEIIRTPNPYAFDHKYSHIGIAFQIKDDLFDYGTKDIGKPRGIDIKEKKMTLPLIHVLQNSTRSEKRRIINVVKNENMNKTKVDELIQYIREQGGLEYTISKMNEYKEKADQILMSMPESIYRTSLFELSEFVINRSR